MCIILAGILFIERLHLFQQSPSNVCIKNSVTIIITSYLNNAFFSQKLNLIFNNEAYEKSNKQHK